VQHKSPAEGIVPLRAGSAVLSWHPRRLCRWAGSRCEPGQGQGGLAVAENDTGAATRSPGKNSIPLQRCRLFPVTRNQAACPWSSWFSGPGGRGWERGGLSSAPRAGMESCAGRGAGGGISGWSSAVLVLRRAVEVMIWITSTPGEWIWEIGEGGAPCHHSLPHPCCVLWHRAPALIPVPVLLPILPSPAPLAARLCFSLITCESD